jgi:hypothetical protein
MAAATSAGVVPGANSRWEPSGSEIFSISDIAHRHSGRDVSGKGAERQACQPP